MGATDEPRSAACPVRAFDRFQRRHRVPAIAVAVLRNFSDQHAGQAAVVIAYYAFFSLFPLLLVFVSILGFVLQGDPSAQRAIVHSALRQFPIIGAKPKSLTGNGVALSIGLVGTLWSGLGVTLAVENAFYRVYAIPPRGQPDFFMSRWRGLKLLAVVGVLQVLSTVAAGAVAGGFGGWLLTVAGIAVALGLNLGAFFVVFRFLIPDLVPTRELWPGIVLAAVSWEVLQSVGGHLRRRTSSRAPARPTARSPPSSDCSRGCTSAPASSSTPPRSTSCSPRAVAAEHHGPSRAR